MEKTPFLTIGIASYNYASYLLKAFEQIKKQRFTDYEVLYCDDGSTDDSVSIIRQIIRENPQVCVRLVEGENEGILANKNRILDNARGSYLMICDADDYMADDCLAAMCSTAQEQMADCVIGGFREVDAGGKVLKTHCPAAQASKWLYTWHHAQIYRTSLVRQYDIRFRQLPDDVCYLQNIHLHCQNVVFVQSVVYNWVRHTGSSSADVMAHPDWHQTKIWHNLSCFIAALPTEKLSEQDRGELNYYLYKWFYFNLTDLPVVSFAQLRGNIKSMQGDMRAALPGYQSLAVLRSALKTPDTTFAKTAVFACWGLEKIGLSFLLSYLRTWQSRMRTFRGKT